MSKYTKKRVDKIVSMYESGDYRIVDICAAAGINMDTFYDWKKNRSDFSDKIKEAEERRLESFKVAARSGLKVLLEGKEYDEITNEYEEVDVIGGDGKLKKQPRLVSQKRTRKFIMPNVAAVIFTLKNQDADNFKDTNHTDLTSKGEKIRTPVTAEQIAALTKQINEMD